MPLKNSFTFISGINVLRLVLPVIVWAAPVNSKISNSTCILKSYKTKKRALWLIVILFAALKNNCTLLSKPGAFWSFTTKYVAVPIPCIVLL